MAHTLTVERLVSTYLVPRDHPAPDQVRRRLDEVARQFMTDSWGRALSAMLDPRDPSVWLIESLAVDFVMNLNLAEPETVAAIWAGKMAESLVKTIVQGADGERVLRFANRAEFLAWFLRDLAAGTAWSRWYYRQFETLRSLPAGPAIREALLREPDQAEATLHHLAGTNRIGIVADCLSHADQEMLVQLCSPEETTPRRAIFEVVLATWAAEPRTSLPLILYLKARTGRADFPAAEVRSAVRHVLTLAGWQQNSRLAGILAAVAAGRLTPVVGQLSPVEQETLLYLAFLASEDAGSPDRLAAMARQAVPVYGKERTAPTDHDSQLYFATRWAGAFLLLAPLIANRDLMRALGGVEDGVLRYLLLTWCLPSNAAEEPEFSETLALAAGLAEAPERLKLEQATPRVELLLRDQDLLPEDVQSLDALDTNRCPEVMLEDSMRRQLQLAAAILLRSFARSLPGLGKSSAAYLWRNLLSGDGVLTATAGRILVELAPRPLEIVLRLAGFDDIRFTPPWLAGTEVVIRTGRH